MLSMSKGTFNGAIGGDCGCWMDPVENRKAYAKCLQAATFEGGELYRVRDCFAVDLHHGG